MLALLSIAIKYNDHSDNLLKFYPLMVFLAAAIIFTVVYFFRAIGVGFDEVRTIGLFSTREHAIINEGKTLTVTLLPKKKLMVELFGNDGVLAELDWLCLDEDGKIPDINLFRAKAIGGKRAALKIISFYGVPKEDAQSVFEGIETYEDDLVTINSSENENGYRQINVKFISTD